MSRGACFQTGRRVFQTRTWAEWTLACATIALACATDGRTESAAAVADNATEYDEMANMTDEEYQNYVVEYITPQKSEWALIVLHSLVFVVGLIGNALVCVAVYR